jgi:hypothetical protein
LFEGAPVASQEGAAAGVSILGPGLALDDLHDALAYRLEVDGISDAGAQGVSGVVIEHQGEAFTDLLELA